MAFGAKVAAVEFAGDEVRVVVAKTGRTPGLLEAHAATAVYETPEERRDAMGRALEEALGRMHSRPTAFVFCADASRATVRTLTVPFRGAENAVVGTTGRTGHQDTLDPYWFREIPVIVRIDLLTRTMQKRGEYGNPGAAVPTADYGTRVQTLMLVPRHFGLPF